MKTARKGLLALIMALAMLFSLTACDDGDNFDPTLYVKGQLDEWYLGVFDTEYLESVESNENEAQEIYVDSIQKEVEAFIYLTNIEYPTEDLNDRLFEIMKDICAKADYTVDPYVKQSEELYLVTVTARPIGIYRQLEDASDAFMEEFEAQFEDITSESFATAEEFDDWYENVYDKAYGEGLADLLETLAADLEYLPEDSITIQIKPDSDGYYTFSDTDMTNLTNLIFPG